MLRTAALLVMLNQYWLITGEPNTALFKYMTNIVNTKYDYDLDKIGNQDMGSHEPMDARLPKMSVVKKSKRRSACSITTQFGLLHFYLHLV